MCYRCSWILCLCVTVVHDSCVYVLHLFMDYVLQMFTNLMFTCMCYRSVIFCLINQVPFSRVVPKGLDIQISPN